MTDTTTQLDLTDEPADDEPIPQFCEYCGVRLAEPHDAGLPDKLAVYRAHRRTHMDWGPDVAPEDDPTRGDNHYSGLDGEPLEIGGVWRFRISYSVEYQITAAGHSRHDAERRAKEMVTDAVPADRYHVHTAVDSSRTVSEADDPEDIPDYLQPDDDEAGAVTAADGGGVTLHAWAADGVGGSSP